jgi:hypothetical protein
MSKKDPKESEFYKRFKFDKDLFDSIFSGDHIADKASLYLTTLVKATLPQQKSKQKKAQVSLSPALERIKKKYKKKESTPINPNPNKEKQPITTPSSIKSTKKTSFENKEPVITQSKIKTPPTNPTIQKTIISTKKTIKKKVADKIVKPKQKKIKKAAILSNIKFVLSYLNPLSKSKPEKIKTTRLDDSIKRLKDREKKIQDLFDKGKGKLS